MSQFIEPLGHYADRAAGGLALLLVHEAGALRGHWSAIGERLSVARRARTTGELLRNQIDLLPESRNRFAHDHSVRLELWKGWLRDLSVAARKLG